MNIDKLTAALGAYIRANNKEIRAMIYNVDSPVLSYARTITKVKGEFPAINSITTDVIQGFQAEWNAIGSTNIRPNILKAYHQKVNYELVPAEIEASWLGDMNEEDLDLAEKSISKYIVEKELKPRAADNVRWLAVNGVYNANALGTFGNSMNGVVKMLTDGVANTDNPMFRIPMSSLTDSNALDQIIAFERQIPAKFRRFIKAIFISTADFAKYKIDYLNTYGSLNFATEQSTMKTPVFNIPLVPVDEMPEGAPVWCTIQDNFLKLVDKFNGPAVTDIQKQDYKLKLFMEFHLGVGFWTNQLVFVGIQGGTGSGLVSGENTLFYR